MKLKKSVLMLSALLLVVGLQCVNAYDRDQIREKLLAIGMPESEITDSMLTKYVDFTNASLENEAKFDNEILAQLQKDNSAKWEEMKQQALKAQQEAEKKKAEEAASAAERQWEAIYSPQNLANPDFTEVAKKMFDAYPRIKKIIELASYGCAEYGGTGDWDNYSSEKEAMLKEVHNFLEIFKSTQMEGFYDYCCPPRYSVDHLLCKGFLALIYVTMEKKANVESMKNLISEIYVKYSNAIKKTYDLKERGNETMISLVPDNGDIIVGLFKDGKFVRAYVPTGKTISSDKLRWADYQQDSPYDGSGQHSNTYSPKLTSDHGLMMANKTIYGVVYGFIDFDWNLYVNQTFCKTFKEKLQYEYHDNSKYYSHPNFCWLVRLKNLSVPDTIEGDPYSKLKFLDANGNIHSNLVNTDDYYAFRGFTTKELLAKKEKEEEADAKAVQAKEQAKKAEQQASFNKIVARCKASNYVELSIYNIVALIERKYIVKAYKSGLYYMDVTNKWGAKRRLHIVDGYVVDQYILR